MAEKDTPVKRRKKPNPNSKLMVAPRGRPPKVMHREVKPKKFCPACQKDRSIAMFYRSKNLVMHGDGYLPYCKDCLCEQAIDQETGVVDVDALKKLLRMCDRPWDEAAYESAVNEVHKRYNLENMSMHDQSKSIVGIVWRMVQSLPQYNMSAEEYEDLQRIKRDAATPITLEEAQQKIKESTIGNKQIYFKDDEDDFNLTSEIVQKFGQGYTVAEYKAMVDKYNFLSQSYPDITNLHTEALVTYVRYKVKEEFAIASGDVDAAEKWANLATKAADKAKINPSQLSQNDLQGGLNSFSELMMAIEQSADIIPILPQFKFRPNDAVDFTIWCYVNYIRRAEGKPMVDYEEIYKFYDERKAEYIAQYGDPNGIFEDDPTEKNRENVKKFITLPKDYGGDNDAKNDSV